MAIKINKIPDATTDQNPLPIVKSSKYIVKIDESDATTYYIGKALPGTLVSEASWQIQRLDTSTIALDSLFANGSNSFNQAWSTRASLSYS